MFLDAYIHAFRQRPARTAVSQGSWLPPGDRLSWKEMMKGTLAVSVILFLRAKTIYLYVTYTIEKNNFLKGNKHTHIYDTMNINLRFYFKCPLGADSLHSNPAFAVS